MKEVRIWLNDREIKVKKRDTILNIANKAGVYIPHLCYHPALKPIGSCRLCAVEIEGYRGFPAACSTTVEDGMRIYTETPRVMEFRRQMLQLILKDHPRECIGCSKNGNCELQKIVQYLGIDDQYLPLKKEYSIKKASRYFEQDSVLCIHCGRCVRVCHEVQGAKAIVFREMDNRLEVSTPLDLPFEEIGCYLCGACVDVCPVGALREVKKEEGLSFEEIPDSLKKIINSLYVKQININSISSLCPICSAGCNLVFDLTDSTVFRIHRKEDFSKDGMGCIEGRFLLKEYLNNRERIKMPMLKEGESYKEKGWEDVLEVIAKKLSSYGPEEIAVLTNGFLTNEELYLLKKFSKALSKKNPIVIAPERFSTISKLLSESIGSISHDTLREMAEKSDCILIVGANPVSSYPVAEAFINMAVLRGSKLIVVNPYNINITRYCDIHLPCFPGREDILIGGIIGTYDIRYVSELTHISPERLEDAFSIINKSKNLYILFGLGIVEGENPIEITKALINLALTKGVNLVPLYGLGNYFGMFNLGIIDGLEAIIPEKIKAVYLVGENLRNEKLPEKVRTFLEGVEFLIVHDVFYPDIDANVLLPMAMILEKGGTFSYKPKPVEKVLNPPKEAKSVVWFLKELFKKMNVGSLDIEKVVFVNDRVQKRISWKPRKIEISQEEKVNEEYPFIVFLKKRLDLGRKR